MLIEAKDLVNGVSILQAESVEQVEYLHIELETHDVIIAEGALSETFIDDDSRFMFHNAHEYAVLYPAAVTPPAQYCAPRLDGGYEVEAIRRRIALRAGLVSEEIFNVGGRAARLCRSGNAACHRGLGAEHRSSRSAGLPRHLRWQPIDRSSSG